MKTNLTNHSLKRELGFFSTTTLVVANMVGTGIFTTSGFIIKELGNPIAMLGCWLVGGIFALTGALCYGELGAMFPQAGGEYIFLRESFGNLTAFLSGWISLLAGFSAPIAAAAIAFAVYFFRALGVSLGPEITLPGWGFNILTISPVTILAGVVIIVFSSLHYHSLVIGSRIQNSLTIFKVSLIIVFILGGLSLGNGSTANFQGIPQLNLCFSKKFASSLIFVAFAYSGWNAAVYLGGEIKEPTRNIPLGLVCGTLLVITIYVLLNIVYVYGLTGKEMRGVIEVGEKTAVSLFGNSASKYFSGAIALSILSVISAMIMTGPRVYFAMSQDGLFFKFFSRLNRNNQTPANSIFLQAAIAIFMVITTTFANLLLYIGFTLSFFAMLTVLGLIILRMTKPHAEPKYRTIAYPFTPILFIAGNLWIIVFSIIAKPITGIIGIGTILIGAITYLLFKPGGPVGPKKQEKRLLQL